MYNATKGSGTFELVDSTGELDVASEGNLIKFGHHLHFDAETHDHGFGTLYEMLSTAVTPVGEYGDEFAADSIRTVEILTAFANHELQGVSSEIAHSNRVLLEGQTARGKHSADEKTNPDLVPLIAFDEGVLSFHQLVSELLINKIPGVNDGLQALRLIVRSRSSTMAHTEGEFLTIQMSR